MEKKPNFEVADRHGLSFVIDHKEGMSATFSNRAVADVVCSALNEGNEKVRSNLLWETSEHSKFCIPFAAELRHNESALINVKK